MTTRTAYEVARRLKRVFADGEFDDCADAFAGGFTVHTRRVTFWAEIDGNRVEVTVRPKGRAK